MEHFDEEDQSEGGFLIAERRSKILAYIAGKGKVKVEDLSKEFGVSEVTIRRDLASLDREGLIERTHGGAVPNHKSRFELSFEQKYQKNVDDKIRIAEQALGLIEDGDAIMLDSGTTTFQLAKRLGVKKNLTIVTNAINMIAELRGIPDISLVLLGGTYKSTTEATIGPMAINNLKEIHVDKLFLGCNSFTIEGGLMTADMIDAETRKAMINASAQVIVLADSSKFGKLSFVSLANIEQIDLIITDKGLDAKMFQAIKEKGIDIVLV